MKNINKNKSCSRDVARMLVFGRNLLAFVILQIIAHSLSLSISTDMTMPTDWYPLASARLHDDVVPQALVECQPRLAKDANYAKAIQDVWKKELRSDCSSEAALHSYEDGQGATCYGHFIKRKEGDMAQSLVPGILLFHTGAGPHDICLQWKADALVTDRDTFPNGCVVLIADILSDDVGWAWSSDRTKYNQARERVLCADGEGVREGLRTKIDAAMKELKEFPGVDSTRLVAMGWCLGGHPVLEIARMKPVGIRAMVTFHGVFDGTPPPEITKEPPKTHPNPDAAKILVCNGKLDPFTQKGLGFAVNTMKQNGYDVTVMQLEGAKHGFTNPAQDFNPNESFRFNAAAAATSWQEALAVLKNV